MRSKPEAARDHKRKRSQLPPKNASPEIQSRKVSTQPQPAQAHGTSNSSANLLETNSTHTRLSIPNPPLTLPSTLQTPQGQILRRPQTYLGQHPGVIRQTFLLGCDIKASLRTFSLSACSDPEKFSSV